MSLDRRIAVIRAGFSRDAETARTALTDDDQMVRVSALRALERIGTLDTEVLRAALADDSDEVRRAAAELSAHHDVDLSRLVDDDDLYVAEMAAWAIGEREHPSDDEMNALITGATSHSQPIVREACAAALGSIGDPRGLQAILTACGDKPAVRRRAVLALAPFEGPEVDAALRAALDDRDWQVRQNAEDLLNPRLTPRD